jgi:hypothetical protein
MPHFRYILQLDEGQRWLLLEAAAWLGLAQLALRVVPFRRIARWLEQRQRGDPRAAGAVPVERVRRAVRVASRRVPWPSRCLAQALAARAMLQRRGIRTTLVLGVAKGVEGDFEAHAWLRCGEHVVTGGDGIERFTVLATFE